MSVNRVIKSFRDFAFESLELFLLKERFPDNNDELVRGCAYLANIIGNYEEEGQRLHPEILVTTNLDAVIQTLPNRLMIAIGKGEIKPATFRRAMKTCAPLARDNWIIYFSVETNAVVYGLMTSGMSEPNPTIYPHVSAILPTLEHPTFFIRALSPKNIEFSGRNRSIVISFSLEEFSHDDYVTPFASHITAAVASDLRPAAKDLLIGLVNQALEESHGTLLAVAKNEPSVEVELLKHLPSGTMLPLAIDLAQYLRTAQAAKDKDSQMALRSIVGIVRRMMGHDGITIFTDDSKVIGYHFFVPSNDASSKETVGGARTRAFDKLASLPYFKAVLFSSHDGAIKFSAKEEI